MRLTVGYCKHCGMRRDNLYMGRYFYGSVQCPDNPQTRQNRDNPHLVGPCEPGGAGVEAAAERVAEQACDTASEAVWDAGEALRNAKHYRGGARAAGGAARAAGGAAQTAAIAARQAGDATP